MAFYFEVVVHTLRDNIGITIHDVTSSTFPRRPPSLHYVSIYKARAINRECQELDSRLLTTLPKTWTRTHLHINTHTHTFRNNPPLPAPVPTPLPKIPYATRRQRHVTMPPASLQLHFSFSRPTKSQLYSQSFSALKLSLASLLGYCTNDSLRPEDPRPPQLQ